MENEAVKFVKNNIRKAGLHSFKSVIRLLLVCQQLHKKNLFLRNHFLLETTELIALLQPNCIPDNQQR